MRLEYLSADGDPERLPSVARELVERKYDLIFAIGPEATARAMRDTRSSIPVVFLAADYDPVERGIVRMPIRETSLPRSARRQKPRVRA